MRPIPDPTQPLAAYVQAQRAAGRKELQRLGKLPKPATTERHEPDRT